MKAQTRSIIGTSRRMCMHSLIMLMTALGCAAVDTTPLASAYATLKINDPRLLDREMTQFAAGLGIDPAPFRSGMARLLFRARTLDGIDLSRPALLAWRKDSPPLLAIIPLTDRRAFLNSFGASFGDEAPLIRISEREGTVVYTQNTDDGLSEYRLLISDRAAYLARSIEECRSLSTVDLPPATTEPPLLFRASGEYLASKATSTLSDAGSVDLPSNLQESNAGKEIKKLADAMRVGWAALVAQIDSIEIGLRPQPDGLFRYEMSIQGKQDSSFWVWVSNQRNQASRLLPLMGRSDAFFTLAGNIMWQGQAEQMGQEFIPVAKSQAGERWTTQLEENWMAMWRLQDRAGPFAMSVDVDVKDGKPAIESRYLSDQSRAQESLSLITLLSQTVTGRIGEVVTAGTATGYLDRHDGVDEVLVANDRFLISVSTNMRDGVEAATELAQRLTKIGAPVGTPGILVMTCNMTPLITMVARLAGQEPQPGLPQTITDITVTTGLPGQLVVTGNIPLSQIARLLRDSGLIHPNRK